MKTALALVTCLLVSFVLVGCGPNVNVDQPYEGCIDSTDVCTQGLSCLTSTLPVATYSGELCTSGCNVDADCLQDLDNFDSICVSNQCYIECPTDGSNCPYGTACFDFQDQDGNPVSVCTP